MTTPCWLMGHSFTRLVWDNNTLVKVCCTRCGRGKSVG